LGGRAAARGVTQVLNRTKPLVCATPSPLPFLVSRTSSFQFLQFFPMELQLHYWSTATSVTTSAQKPILALGIVTTRWTFALTKYKYT